MLLRVRETPSPMNQFIPRQDNASSSTASTGNTSRTSASASGTSRTSSASQTTSSSQSTTSSAVVSSSIISTTSTTSSQSSSASSSSASSSASATLASESSGSGPSTGVLIGAIVGGVIGGLLLLSMVSILFSAWRRRRNDARKRPRMSVVAGDISTRGKRPATLYTLDSFLAPTGSTTQAKPSQIQRDSDASAIAVPLLGTSSSSTIPDRMHGVDEHGAVVERYTDRPPSRGSVTERTEDSHLVSPYSVDDHGAGTNDETAPRIPRSDATAFAPFTVPAAGFRLDTPPQESTPSMPRKPTPPLLSLSSPPSGTSSS